MRCSQLLLLTMAVAACSTSPDINPGESVLIDTLPGGIVRVTNRGLPPLASTGGMHLSEAVVIDPPDDSPGMLTTLGNMAFDQDGNLLISTRRPTQILVFDHQGVFLRKFGREGDGPGELVQGGGVLALQGDTLVVHQPPQGRVTWFTREGTYLSEIRTDARGRWGLDPIVWDRQGRLWLEGVGVDPVARPPKANPDGMPFNGPGWLRIDSQGRILDSIGFPQDATLPTTRTWTANIQIGDEVASGAMRIPHQVALSFSPRHDGNIVVGRNDGDLLRLSGNGQDTLRLIRLPLPQVPMTEADRVAEMGKAVPPGSPFEKTAKTSDLPRFWPRFARLVVDPSDRIWLLVPGQGKPVAELWVLAPDGTLLNRFPAPEGQIDRAVWGQDRIAVPDQSEDGRLVIRIYTIVE